jgi:anti-sigma B factor antagonist
MQAIIDKVGDVAVVLLPYEKIDASCRTEFRADLEPILSEPNPKVVIDMTNVRFVDSAGIGALISCLKRATSNDGDLKLCHVAKPVRALFELVRLHRLLDILNSREEAVAAFEED